MTKLTRKQVNVIFANYKKGNLKIDRELISKLYDNADLSGWQAQERMNQSSFWFNAIFNAIEAIFNNDFETAQKNLNLATEL